VRKWRTRLDFTWLLLAGAVALGVLAFSSIVLVDDAYISFRYSHNLAEGRGLVFNEGEYVEGYTNVLWTLLMVLPELLNIPVHLFAAYGGLAFGLLALFETWRALGMLEVCGWPRGLAVLALGAYTEFWLAATMGLEGGLFAFLLALSARLLFSGKMAWAGLVGGLMFATRPESLLLIGIFTLYILFDEELDGRWFVRLLRLSAPWLGLFVALTLWRLYYYGTWLPNTITAKAPPERSLDLLANNATLGALYTADFALAAAPLVVGTLLALVLAPKSRAVWLCIGAVAAELLAVLVNGGDWMPNHRLLSVFAPVLAIPLGVAAGRLETILRPVLPASLLLAVAGFLAVPLAMAWQNYSWEPRPDAHISTGDGCYRAIGEAVRPALGPSDVIVPAALGLVSYLNPEVYSHDPFGLTDEEIAKHGSYYFASLGKMDPLITYSTDFTFFATHDGPGIPRWLNDETEGEYGREYLTYRLDDAVPGQVPGCGGGEYVVAIREDSGPRILPALAELNPQLVQMPGS
jgi:hypothetical protein